MFIASTNLMDGQDQAALRRFDLKVRFDYLRPDQAWALFETTPVPGTTGAEQHETPYARLGNLTPRDFSAVARQHRFRPFGSAEALAALEAECQLKKSHGRAVGFLWTCLPPGASKMRFEMGNNDCEPATEVVTEVGAQIMLEGIRSGMMGLITAERGY